MKGDIMAKSKGTKKVAPVVNKDLVNEAVEFINESANKTVYTGYLEIGNYVLEKFFDNDIEKASSRNPRKPESFKALCKREDLALKLTTLTMTVRVAAQEKYFIENKVKTDSLTFTHKAELIKLPNDKTKISLVNKCIKNKLSTRKLSTEVAKKLELLPRKSDLPTSQFLKLRFKSLDGLFEKEANRDLPNLTKLKGMRKSTIEELKASCEIMLEKLKRVSDEYQTLPPAI
jgi:hypothetical protein